MTIEDWTSPDSNLEPADSDDEDAGGPSDGPDCDPEYFEHIIPPCLDPVDEPQFTDADIYQLLYSSLGDLAEEEWVDMCEFLPIDCL